MNNTVSERNRMLKEISIIDFALVELAEYLDTHPHDCRAMEYFNHYVKIKNQMSKEFSLRYFPLQLDLSTNTKEWSWVLEPMPWEGVWSEGGCN